jgi:hypothetical protein
MRTTPSGRHDAVPPAGRCKRQRRETRRAVRRPVRRATLRDPNISFLQLCAAVYAAESMCRGLCR